MSDKVLIRADGQRWWSALTVTVTVTPSAIMGVKIIISADTMTISAEQYYSMR